MGEVRIPRDALWGTQTQRCLDCFGFGAEKMPESVLTGLFLLKKHCAVVNHALCPDRMTEKKKDAIVKICDALIRGEYEEAFPLTVWQTGSGTATNMNVNEVISHLVKKKYGADVHPNDDVNMSQSSNDIFPAAVHIAAVRGLMHVVSDGVEPLLKTLEQLEKKYKDTVKCGRTHLQDAVPMTFGQEVSGWKAMLGRDEEAVRRSMEGLKELPVGGTAVGTGLNVPQGFAERVVDSLSQEIGIRFCVAENKFEKLSSAGDIAFAHGALKTLAADLMKIANDIRFLASGPNCGLGEITIPSNEPGSSIMPGKVNPTQCEVLCNVALQVMGNDVTIGTAASQGQFQLNTYRPLIAYNFFQSCNLLADAMKSFDRYCLSGLSANREKMKENVGRSLMTVTSLTPAIGYERAAEIAKKAQSESLTVKEACLKLGYLSEEEFDRIWSPEKMAGL